MIRFDCPSVELHTELCNLHGYSAVTMPTGAEVLVELRKADVRAGSWRISREPWPVPCRGCGSFERTTGEEGGRLPPPGVMGVGVRSGHRALHVGQLLEQPGRLRLRQRVGPPVDAGSVMTVVRMAMPALGIADWG